MNQRKPSKALTPSQARDLIEAAHFASKIGKPLNTGVSIHPNCLLHPPVDVGHWVSGLLNHLRIWCTRQGFGYSCIWVRENYEGAGREHLHLVLHVPPVERALLQATLEEWLPGSPNLVRVKPAEFGTDRYGRHVNKAVTYVLKQMTPQARYALHHRVRRESECKVTGAKVAPVLGKRCGTSANIDAKARESARLASRASMPAFDMRIAA